MLVVNLSFFLARVGPISATDSWLYWMNGNLQALKERHGLRRNNENPSSTGLSGKIKQLFVDPDHLRAFLSCSSSSNFTVTNSEDAVGT